jgi:hypothetical protein
LYRVRALITDRDHDAFGAVVRRLCVLNRPDAAVAMLNELSGLAGFGEVGAQEAAATGVSELLLERGHVTQALEVLQFLPDINAWGDTPRLDSLMAMLPELVRVDPAEARKSVHALSGVRAQERWLRLLSVYAGAMTEGPGSELVRSWDESLRLAASRTRAQALAILTALQPMTQVLGGVEEEARSIQLVRRWWS